MISSFQTGKSDPVWTPRCFTLSHPETVFVCAPVSLNPLVSITPALFYGKSSHSYTARPKSANLQNIQANPTIFFFFFADSHQQ